MKALLIEIEMGRWGTLYFNKDIQELPWNEWPIPTQYLDKRKIYTEDEAVLNANPAQIVVDENGVPSIDIKWAINLMSPDDIRVRHQNKLEEQLDAELAKEIPDPIIAIKLQRSLDTSKDLTELELYQIAKDSLQYADIEKPLIVEKLDAKIKELGQDE
jgi:hypothetical protein